MSVTLKQILSTAAVAIMLASCEEVIVPDRRYTPTKAPEPQRTVLIEEYTATDCPTGPGGHAVLNALEQAYNTEANRMKGAGIVVVGLYTPGDKNEPDQAGLVSPAAKSLIPKGIIPPQACINRKGEPLNRDKWAAAAVMLAAVEPQITFPTEIVAAESDGIITVSGRLSPTENFDNARLHVWLVEDGVVGPQMLPDGSTDSKYVHNNVFRTAVTPVNGHEMMFVRNSDRTFTFHCPLDSRWKAANMSAVVFVETIDDGVLNATRSRITQSGN